MLWPTQILKMKTTVQAIVVASLCLLSACATASVQNVANTGSANTNVVIEQGELSTKGGSPTKRKKTTPKDDDPATTNDERNDQEVGAYGTTTLNVHYPKTGRTFTLDADVKNLEGGGHILHRIYFPKGGWVDFIECELPENYESSCFDENNRRWVILGER